MKILKDLKEECECTWQHDEQTKELCLKRWHNECNACEKVESNEMFNEHKYILKKKHLSESSVGVLGVFHKGVLRIIDDNRELTRIEQHKD